MMMYIRLFYWSYIDSTENDEVSEVVEESRANSEPPRGVYVKLINYLTKFYNLIFSVVHPITIPRGILKTERTRKFPFLLW